MSQGNVVSSILKQCKLTEADGDAVEASANAFVYDLLNSYEWSFRLKNHTDTTLASTHLYTLQGVSEDCSQIVDIYYDKSDTPLDYLYPREFDRRTRGIDPKYREVTKWTARGEDVQGFPQIELSGDTLPDKDLYYSYLCKVELNDPWALLPVAMSQIIIEHGISQHNPDPQRRVEAYSHVYGDDRKSGMIANARRRWRLRSLTTTQGRIDEQKRRINREISLGSQFNRVLYTGD